MIRGIRAFPMNRNQNPRRPKKRIESIIRYIVGLSNASVVRETRFLVWSAGLKNEEITLSHNIVVAPNCKVLKHPLTKQLLKESSHQVNNLKISNF